MKKAYEKLWVEVINFRNEVIMSDEEDIVFSLGDDALEDGGEY